MLFSVVIPAFNRLDYLRETLESVWRQTFTNYEIIVVDDGSTDGTREWLASQGKPLRVLTQANRGAGSARNLGAQHSHGEYLAFLDSDDLWFPWTLEVYQKLATRDDSPAFITGMPLTFTTSAETRRARNDDLVVEAFSDYFASGDAWRWFSASSFVISKDAFIGVGGFHEDWGWEDAHLTMKLGCSPGFVHIQQPYTFAYRDHSNSLKTSPTYSTSGADLLIRSEHNRDFPGGKERANERLLIVTRHIRAATVECARLGLRAEAWRLYQATFRWNLRLGRWKYLAGFPLKVLAS